MTGEAILIDRDGNPTLCFERRFRQPLERVWRAVTDEHEMRAWFPAGVVGERRVGAPLSFPFDDASVDTFEGEVTAWEPPRVFAFTWNGEQLRIELHADGDGTRLVFRHVIDVSEAARTAAGWDACLGNLDAHLGGPPADPDTWRDAYPGYLQHMGPPLGVPGADGSMTWTRWHHVSPEDFDRGFADVASWGGDALPQDDLAVTRSPGEHGTSYRVTHRTAGTDPALAARWHAVLTQLDMALASHQLVPVDPALFIEDYEHLLA